MTTVKGHADAEMVRVGRVRELDSLGNLAAGEEPHRFFIAISSAVVFHDGLRVLPLTPSWGLLQVASFCGTTLCCLAPAVIWASDRVSLPPAVIAPEDVGAWLHSVGILVKWVTFLGTLALAGCWSWPESWWGFPR